MRHNHCLPLPGVGAGYPLLCGSRNVARSEPPAADAARIPADEPPLSYLAALTYNLTPGDAEGVIRRLNMPSDWVRVVRNTVELKQLEPRLADPSLLDSQVVEMIESFTEAAVTAVSKVT